MPAPRVQQSDLTLSVPTQRLSPTVVLVCAKIYSVFLLIIVVQVETWVRAQRLLSQSFYDMSKCL